MINLLNFHANTETHILTNVISHIHTHTQAQREDELDVAPEEVLEVLEWDDGDGWCKGKNKLGKEGYFPQSYVQPSSRSSSPPTAQHQDSVTTINSVSTITSIDTLNSATSPSIPNGSGMCND